MSGLISILLKPFFYFRILHLKGKKQLTTLCFHNISSTYDPYYPALHPYIFEDLCKYFSKHFQVVNFKTIDQYQNSKKPLMVISFDDAYLDYYEVALPILEKYNLTSVLNVITVCPDEKRTYIWQTFVNFFKRIDNEQCLKFGRHYNFYYNNFNPEQFVLAFTQFFQSLEKPDIDNLALKYLEERDYKASKMMSWDQIREVNQKGHEIGAHTHNHYYINSLKKEEIAFELKHSKKRLEEELNIPISTFAFPGAKYNEENITLAESIGLKNCLLMENKTTSIGSNRIYRYLSYGNSTVRLLIQSLGIESLLRR